MLPLILLVLFVPVVVASGIQYVRLVLAAGNERN